MSLQVRIESLVLRLAAEFKTIYGQVGTLASLSTTDKTSLLTFAMDLTPLVMDDSLSIEDYTLGYVNRLAEDVRDRLRRHM